MVWSFRNEIARKAVHLSSILLLLIYILIKDILIVNEFGKQIGLFVLMIFLICALVYEFLRLNLKWKLPLSELTRLREKNRHTSLIYMLSGMILSLAVFDERIAYASILMGIFGDFIVGILHGANPVGVIPTKKRRRPHELLIEMIVNFIVGIVIFPNILIIFFMSLSATIVELLFDSEDNLAIPVFSGFIGQIIFWIFK